MASTSPNVAGSSDGPNKKFRLLELFQLPDSLDDAVLQPSSATTQQQLPADEARRQLDTLQLGSGDEPSSPRLMAAAAAAVADAGVAVSAPPVPASTAAATAPAQQAAKGAGSTPLTVGPLGAAGARDEPVGSCAYQREASLEPAPSDPGVCISLDIVAGSSALDGLGGDECEGEVASRRSGGSALVGSGGSAGNGVRGGGVEVFIGGLAAEAREEEVRAALTELGQGAVLSVRLQMTRGTSVCKGYGFATFADEATAHRAVCAAAAGTPVCGRRVGLHASRQPFRSVLAAAQAAGAQPPLQLHPDSSASVNALLVALRAHPDRRAAVAAALLVVQRGAKRAFASAACDGAAGGSGAAAGAQRVTAAGKRQATGAAAVVVTAAAEPPGAAAVDGTAVVNNNGVTANRDSTAAAAGKVSEDAAKENGVKDGSAGDGAAAVAAATAVKKSAAAAPAAGGQAAPSAAVGGASTTTAGGGGGAAAGGQSQDLTAALVAYPKISKLLDSLRASSRVPKTPLMVLHEYATKMNYEVSYVETSEGPAGPYSVDARLVGCGHGAATIVTASGKARTKKDAKQVAAAACLEKLLEGPRGLAPQDLLPAPKLLPGPAGRAAKGAPDRGGVGYQSAVPGGKKPMGRHGVGHQAGVPHWEPMQHRGGAPPLPPPPPGHSTHMSTRGHGGGGQQYGSGGGPQYGSSGPPYGSGGSGANLGPIGRGPFSGGGGGTAPGNNGGYSFVQPGLMPANAAAGGGIGRPGGSAAAVGGPFGGPLEGRGPMGRSLRSGGDTYGGAFGGGGSGGGGLGYGGVGSSNAQAVTATGGAGSGAGGGGSMVQLGLNRGGAVGAEASGGGYGNLYGRDSSGPGSGAGLDAYGGMSSYDMAAGQKRNYSTAMQAAYGSPASSQGLLPVRPPEQPVISAGGVLGGAGNQDPFATQAGSRSFLGAGGGQQQHQPMRQQVQMQSPGFGGQQQQQGTPQPVFGQSPTQQGFQQQQASLQPVFAQQQHHHQHHQHPQAAPLQPSFAGQQQYPQGHGQSQQQSLLGISQVFPSSDFYSGGQAVQLQPAQPQALFTAGGPPTGQSQQNMYGVASSQQQQQQQAGGMYGSLQQQQQAQVQQGGLFGSGAVPQQQQHQQHASLQAQVPSLYGMSQQQHQQLQPEQQQYTLPPTASPGLQAFGAVRQGGSLWG